SSDNTAVATVDGATGLVVGISSGTANIIFTVTSTYTPACTSSTSIASVTVNNNAAAAITGGPNVCVGYTTAYTGTATYGTGAYESDNSAIAVVNAVTGIVTGITSGTADIIFTVTSTYTPACTGSTSSSPVTVNNNTTAALVGGPNVCVGY